MKGEWLFQ